MSPKNRWPHKCGRVLSADQFQEFSSLSAVDVTNEADVVLLRQWVSAMDGWITCQWKPPQARHSCLPKKLHSITLGGDNCICVICTTDDPLRIQVVSIAQSACGRDPSARRSPNRHRYSGRDRSLAGELRRLVMAEVNNSANSHKADRQ